MKTDPKVKELLIYPKRPEDFPQQPTDDWVFVLADAKLIEGFKKYGSIIVGLDSFFKASKYRNPLWAVVYQDKLLEGVLGAVIIASSGKSSLLRIGKIVRHHY
jgi:hypothetical protein